MQTRDRDYWNNTMRLAPEGHNPDPVQAVEVSLREAESFYRNGIVFAGAKILDIGSGNGRQAIGLMDYEPGEYVGIEPIKACVEFSKAAFSKYGNFKFIWMDMKNDMYNPGGAVDPLAFRIPFDNGYFDSVIAGSLFTHLGTAEICCHYLEEIARVLKVNGKIFSSWFRDPPNTADAAHARTVLPESRIINMVCRHFEVYNTSGGIKSGYNDQWRIYAQKAVPR